MCWDGQNDISNASVGYVGEPVPQNPLLSSTTMTEPFIIDGFSPLLWMKTLRFRKS